MVRTEGTKHGRKGEHCESESAFIHSLTQILDTSSMLIILAPSDTKVTEEVRTLASWSTYQQGAKDHE